MHRASRIFIEFRIMVWWAAATTTANATTRNPNNIKWDKFRWYDTHTCINEDFTTQFSSRTRTSLSPTRTFWLLSSRCCQFGHTCEFNRITSALYKVSCTFFSLWNHNEYLWKDVWMNKSERKWYVEVLEYLMLEMLDAVLYSLTNKKKSSNWEDFDLNLSRSHSYPKHFVKLPPKNIQALSLPTPESSFTSTKKQRVKKGGLLTLILWCHV